MWLSPRRSRSHELLIHGQQDDLVDWPCKARLKGMTDCPTTSAAGLDRARASVMEVSVSASVLVTRTAHFPAFLHLRVTNRPGPVSIVRSDQAQQRRMEKATGRYERERLRKRLGQQAASSTADLVDPAQCNADRRDSALCQYRP